MRLVHCTMVSDVEEWQCCWESTRFAGEVDIKKKASPNDIFDSEVSLQSFLPRLRRSSTQGAIASFYEMPPS